MDTDIKEIRRKAANGDESAIFHLLERQEPLDPKAIDHIKKWRRRDRDRTLFLNLVAARKHYVKRGWLGISKPDRIKEMIEQFPVKKYMANHLADGKGYAEVRAEAQRQLKAEAEAEAEAEADGTESHGDCGKSHGDCGMHAETSADIS